MAELTNQERSLLYTLLQAVRQAPEKRKALIELARDEDASAKYREILAKLESAGETDVRSTAESIRQQLF